MPAGVDGIASRWPSARCSSTRLGDRARSSLRWPVGLTVVLTLTDTEYLPTGNRNLVMFFANLHPGHAGPSNLRRELPAAGRGDRGVCSHPTGRRDDDDVRR